MILYFDEQGTLKEIIEEEPFRVGNSKRNKLKIYVDSDFSPTKLWFKFRKPDGSSTIEQSISGNAKVNVSLPTSPKRNFNYFDYNHTWSKNGTTYLGYPCWEIVVPDDVLSSSLTDDITEPSANNLVVCRVRFTLNDGEIFTLGAITFSVQSSIGILTDGSIDETQYNYLLTQTQFKVVEVTDTMETSTLPSIVVPKLSVAQLQDINNNIYEGYVVAIKYLDSYFVVNEIDGSKNGVKIIYNQAYLDYYIEGNNVICEYVDLSGDKYLEKKVSSNSNSFVYAYDLNGQKVYEASQEMRGENVIPLRRAGGQITVAQIPEGGTDATSKYYVDYSISNLSARYLTKNTNGDSFTTYAELVAGPWYYGGTQVLRDRNDYAFVQQDETHENKSSRYVYQAGKWLFQYTLAAGSPLITDVRVNGVSVVSNTVANIDTTNLMPKVLEVSINMDTTQLQQSINSFNPIVYTADNVSTVRDFILAQEGTIKLTINTPVGTVCMALKPSFWKFEGDVYSYNFEGSDTLPFDLTSIGGTAFNQIIVSLVYTADTVNLVSTILPVEASNVLEIPITKIITNQSKIETLIGAMSASNSVLTTVEFDTPIQYSELDGKDYIKLDLSSLGVNGYYMFYNQTTLNELGRSYNLTIYSLNLAGVIIRNLAMIGLDSALTCFIIDVNVKNSYYCTETEVDNKINAAIGNVLNGDF